MMRRTTGDEKPGETLTEATPGSSVGRARARGWPRRKAKRDISALTIVPERHDRLDLDRPHKRAQTIEDLGESKPENVESLTKYRPRSKTYRVSLIFSGEAGSVMSDLMAELQVDDPNDVVKPALALLLSARGKEVLLRDPETGAVSLVEICISNPREERGIS